MCEHSMQPLLQAQQHAWHQLGHCSKIAMRKYLSVHTTSWVLVNQSPWSLCRLQAVGKVSKDRASRCTSTCPSIPWCWPALLGCTAAVWSTTHVWFVPSASEPHERRGMQQPIRIPLHKCQQWMQRQTLVPSPVLLFEKNRC